MPSLNFESPASKRRRIKEEKESEREEEKERKAEFKDYTKELFDELKQAVQLAVHEQKDPLVFYKFEAKELFFAMIDQLNKDILTFLFKGSLPSNNPNEIREDRQTRRREKYNTSKEEVLNSDELANRNRQVGSNASSNQSVVETVVREARKIGRNERVKIKNIQSGELKELKFKQAEPLLQSGNWNIIEN